MNKAKKITLILLIFLVGLIAFLIMLSLIYSKDLIQTRLIEKKQTPNHFKGPTGLPSTAGPSSLPPSSLIP